MSIETATIPGTKTFIVEGQGETPIGADNAIFTMFCVDRDKLSRLEVEQGTHMEFKSGAGRTRAYVFRVS